MIIVANLFQEITLNIHKPCFLLQHSADFLWVSNGTQIGSANDIFQIHCSENFKPKLKDNFEGALFCSLLQH